LYRADAKLFEHGGQFGDAARAETGFRKEKPVTAKLARSAELPECHGASR
jgi:hypothetical protein